MWNILNSGINSASGNMEKDHELLCALSSTKNPILHLYDWEGSCATYGYFTDPYNYLNRDAVEYHNISLARRPTGGGILFHMTDFAFSILVPASHPAYSVNTLENYHFVNNIVIKAVQGYIASHPTLLPEEPVAYNSNSKHFCMAKPTKYDVMIDKKKVGGAAQRRTKHGFLHQGTLSLTNPPQKVLTDLLCNHPFVIDAMGENSYFILGKDASTKALLEARKKIAQSLQNTVMTIPLPVQTLKF